jgi:hypothetical protein
MCKGDTPAVNYERRSALAAKMAVIGSLWLSVLLLLLEGLVPMAYPQSELIHLEI